VPVATLNNPSPGTTDWFGYSVAISGTRVVVGAYQDDTGATDAGSAYVYDLASATPTVPVATLNNPSPAAYDYFGSSVSISGTRVVVGTPGDDTVATGAGRSYVYDLASATPTVPVATLNNPRPAGGGFGNSVAISGTRVVVGAPYDDTWATDAGSAYVFDLASATPTVPVATLNNPSPAAYDQFGSSLSISGTRVVVGAPYDDTWATDAGSAYVFDLASATPTVPVATLYNPTPAQRNDHRLAVAISGTRVVIGAYDDFIFPNIDEGTVYVHDLTSTTPAVPVIRLISYPLVARPFFGFSVGVSGTRVVVGTGHPHNPREYEDDAGSTYVYDLAGASPTVPVAALENPSPETLNYFGRSVSISGTRVVVGAYRDNTGADQAGRAYVYDIASGSPGSPIATLNNPSPGTNDFFGFAVAISGTRVVIGAYQDGPTGNSDAGRAFVYDLTSGTPAVPVVTLNNPIQAAQGYFGYSVAISGTRVVVGAIADDSGATDAGRAYVYDLAGATPTVPVATLNNPSPGTTDWFGYSVAISGTRVVVGAIFDDTGATDAGSAYVYDLASATPALPLVTLNNPSPAASDLFGGSVAISGTRVVIGAYLNDTGADASGIAYLYDVASAMPWVPVATLTNPSPAARDYFGTSVAVDGTTVVAGAFRDDTNAADRGAAYVFGPLRPALRIVRAAPGFATISWTPSNSPGFVLQYADRLAPSNWANAPSGAANPVTVQTTNTSRFYRLFNP
jgi:hypothetical protein